VFHGAERGVRRENWRVTKTMRKGKRTEKRLRVRGLKRVHSALGTSLNAVGRARRRKTRETVERKMGIG